MVVVPPLVVMSASVIPTMIRSAKAINNCVVTLVFLVGWSFIINHLFSIFLSTSKTVYGVMTVYIVEIIIPCECVACLITASFYSHFYDATDCFSCTVKVLILVVLFT